MKDLLTLQGFETLVFEFRGRKVLLDMDLAILYETETKKLKQQVRRNMSRFPSDFMFELEDEEKQYLIKNYLRLSNLKHSSASPMVFTEQGVAMLSSVLTSQKAIEINIGIMRAFAHYRTMLLESKKLRKEIKSLDIKLDKAFKYLLSKIDDLTDQKANALPLIGFKQSKREDKD
ncbi:MAG: ORF6N domain-containing protein [Cyclobacteriaceae bacterium]|nr:ORF6N domain-containing protein [Cyclobacteriaceae bacterium]